MRGMQSNNRRKTVITVIGTRYPRCGGNNDETAHLTLHQARIPRLTASTEAARSAASTIRRRMRSTMSAPRASMTRRRCAVGTTSCGSRIATHTRPPLRAMSRRGLPSRRTRPNAGMHLAQPGSSTGPARPIRALRAGWRQRWRHWKTAPMRGLAPRFAGLTTPGTTRCGHSVPCISIAARSTSSWRRLVFAWRHWAARERPMHYTR